MDKKILGKKSLLWMAAQVNDLDAAEQLLRRGHHSPNEATPHKGWTPLMKVAEYDHVEIARLLVEYEANLEDTNHRGRTALSVAAAPSMGLPTAVNTLRYLLQQGASQVAVDDRGRTPRDQAEAEKRSDAIAIFASKMLHNAPVK